jgi:hypothetical protein
VTQGQERSPGTNVTRAYVRMGGNNNLFGLLSVVAGLFSCGCCCCPFNFLQTAAVLPSLAAIAFGLLHLHRVDRGRASGKALATVGIGLGLVTLAIVVVFALTGAGGELQDRYGPFN